MKKFSVKSWWLSLFGKNEFEENGELDKVENINEIEELKEIEIIQMNEESNEIETPKEIEVIQTNQNNHSNGSLNTEVVFPLYDGKYDGLFSTPKIPIPLSVVDQELWDRIQNKLPENYIIPCPTSKYLYNIHSSKRI
ncbi:hypothetical protein UACE39S_00325 [Ureibacillus acetophenoni]